MTKFVDEFWPAAGYDGAVMLELDHIAVAGATLDEATEACEAALGVKLQPGGRHALFGTHNRLLGLADGLYLEAIATDPDAPEPERARLVGLDRFSGRARPTNWICRCDDLAAMLAHLPDGLGAPVALGRADLRWLMSAPKDGVLPFDNCHPALIQWQSLTHPSAMLEESGCRLRRLTVRHPEADSLQALLRPLLDDRRVMVETGAPALAAEFDTPHGTRLLE